MMHKYVYVQETRNGSIIHEHPLRGRDEIVHTSLLSRPKQQSTSIRNEQMWAEKNRKTHATLLYRYRYIHYIILVPITITHTIKYLMNRWKMPFYFFSPIYAIAIISVYLCDMVCNARERQNDGRERERTNEWRQMGNENFVQFATINSQQ